MPIAASLARLSQNGGNFRKNRAVNIGRGEHWQLDETIWINRRSGVESLAHEQAVIRRFNCVGTGRDRHRAAQSSHYLVVVDARTPILVGPAGVTEGLGYSFI
jgi:hypothetical protein